MTIEFSILKISCFEISIMIQHFRDFHSDINFDFHRNLDRFGNDNSDRSFYVTTRFDHVQKFSQKFWPWKKILSFENVDSKPNFDNLKILDLTEISTMKEHSIRNQNHGNIGS